MKDSNYRLVQIYCSNCGHKVMGYTSENGMMRLTCKRCGTVLFSKKYGSREMNLKIIAPQN